ncbi:hypothetical protein FSP39_009261 [Pinctada imbricata]|uniref:C1q domain-containing protein n=1 Tax=Pinctada imbricata TaxID=66713 RepID=A0AA88XLM5_PINIB|nr:hypothetical protein FSP39_009261 [Pinctada imbricata]
MDNSIGKYHTFVYDRLISNIGGAYNKHSGIFTAPKSGVFAFLWTIFVESRHPIDGQFGEIVTELMVNSHITGYSAVDTEKDADDDQAMGFAIVQLSQGDVAYIRSASNPQGTLQNDYRGEWTFSGWQIS